MLLVNLLKYPKFAGALSKFFAQYFIPTQPQLSVGLRRRSCATP